MSQQPSFDELHRALYKSAVLIQEQKRALASYREPIAVIGMGCRFPGDVTSPATFWDLLQRGISAASPRSVLQDYPGHYLGEPGWFDAAFFGIAPREAEAMDPQQHLLLEVCVEALQDANIAISDLLGSRTGVYIGVMNQDYVHLLGQQEVRSVYASTGSEMSFLAGRLSYSFGLHGPSMTVGTACSSSLVSTHLACQALRSHECQLAVAGGVSLILTPLVSNALAEMHATAPDGLSKTFDAQADGYGRGEGCGVLILKRLTDAERDGDTIYALIRGAAVNHDGRSGGLTVPNGLAQETLLRQALAAAQVEGHAISYVEAHGTGTVLGDPIELRALSNVLGPGRINPLLVGSVKTNIGHLESAAGVAGLMKVILALRHRQIPPHLHLHEPNPHIPWQDVPLRVPTELTAWDSDGLRLAGVSSFGLSGVNAHIILQEAPQRPDTSVMDPRPCHLLALSAKHPQALTDLLRRAHTHLLSTEGGAWGDICYTAQVGRAHYSHRLALVASSQAEAAAQIAAYLTTHDPTGLQVGQIQQPAPQVAFLFTGQGSQYAGMGMDLNATEPTFREALDACAAILDPLLGRPLRTVLTDPALIDQTTYTQPALFALEYALARMWHAWGIEPAILIGHSVGELVAACLAEVFSLEDGLRLVAARGRLMGDLPPDGAMVALAVDAARVRDAIAPYAEDVSIAAVNGPTSVVISGRTDVVQAIAAQFAAEGVRTQALTVSHAFHSPLLDPMLEAFRAVAEGITYHPPTRRLVSNLTGDLAEEAVATPDYWVRHVREAVRFADGVQTLHAQGVDVLLEIGPKPVLLGMVGDREPGVALLPSVRAGQGAWQTLLTSLGTLYVRGAAVNWAGLHRAAVRHKVALPTYPFQRQRYWVDAPAAAPRRETVRPLVDQVIRVPQRGETICATTFSVAALPFLTDHQVYEEVVSPVACQLVLALSAAELSLGTSEGLILHDVILSQALVLPEGQARTVLAIVSPPPEPQGATRVFEITSFPADGMGDGGTVAIHATGKVTPNLRLEYLGDNLAALQQRCTVPLDLDAWEMTGVTLGPTFRWIVEAWQGGEPTAPEILARLARPATVATLDGYPIHPGLLDACFQVTGLLTPPDEEMLLPFPLEALHWDAPATGDSWWCYARLTGSHTWDVQLHAAAGAVVARLSGFPLRTAPTSAIRGKRLRRDWLTTLVWQPQPQPTEPEPPPACWLIVGASDTLAAELLTSAPVIHLPTTTDAATLRQQVADLAAQYASLGVVFGVEDVAHGAIPHDGHSERSEESRLEPFTALRVDMQASATTEEEDTTAPAAALTACTALLHLSQALSATSGTVRLWVVTTGAHVMAGDVVGGSAVPAVGGSLWGFGRTLAREEPHLRCILIDLDARQPAAWAATLAAELQRGTDAAQVAWRGGTRFVAQLEPWHSPQDNPKHAGTEQLCPEASYLITGELGALGLQVAEQLVADGARHLVLSSRHSAPTTAQQATLDRLIAAGATVAVVSADIGDAAQVQALLAHCATLGRLRGIVHAAGVLDDGVLAAQTPARLAGVMRPKVAGAWHLHTLSAGLDLDFFVAFSSLASLLGSAGQSTYAAANGFMDGLMQARRAQGLPGLSINWGPWAEVGIAASLSAQFERQGLGMIAPAQGRAIFQHLLRHGNAHVAVMVMQRPVGGAAPRHSNSLRADIATLPRSERQERLVEVIREAVAQVVGMHMPTQIDPVQPLLEFGVDSLMAIQIRKWVQNILGVDLALSVVLDGSSVRSLAAIVAEQITSGKSAQDPSAMHGRDGVQPIPAATTMPQASITHVPGAGESSYIEVEGEL